MFCKHLDKPLEFVRNITGDEINLAGGKRSVWRCPDCGKLQVRRASESEIYEYEHRFDKEKE